MIVLLSLYTKNDRFIEWQSDYKLKFEDFRRIPKKDSVMAAETAYLTHSQSEIIGDSLKLTFSCVFDKDSSWISERDSAILEHEQLHFDIAELSVRYFQIMCLKTQFFKPKIQFQLDSINRIVSRKSNDMQDLYDKDIQEFDPLQQEKWNKIVFNELKRTAYLSKKELLIELK